MPVTVPCGKCWSCRLSKSRDWAIRCVHESKMHKRNCFITLTYNDEHLPADRSVHKEELQKFFKRLRKRLGHKIRYFACGEYGTKNLRPHYHAIIFGTDFDDKKLWQQTQNGDFLYRSDTLEKAWSRNGSSMGFCTIGDVTFQSAAYVARYCMKKFNNPQDPEKVIEHYTRQIIDKNTGEHKGETIVQPEFCLMSRGGSADDPHRGGIGASWLRKYKSDTDKDFITLQGLKLALPRYYDSMLEMEDAMDMEQRKIKRKKALEKHADDNTLARLAVKEKVKQAQTSTLKRNL